ncbi:MAG: class I SAM-dependent methyltransferase [Rhodocyclaceae bacterium]
MDKLTALFKSHHAELFQTHGATPRGVDWNDEAEMLYRYEKMLGVFNKDFLGLQDMPTLLDVGCGWGGLLKYAMEHERSFDYTGIDVVEEMISYCKRTYDNAVFQVADVFALDPESEQYDFVVCNAILTQRLTASITEMDEFSKRLVTKMFSLCRHGIAFNMMSNKVNFMVDNLFYKSPLEMVGFCFDQLSPRVRLDHGYSSLSNQKGKYYDFTMYVFKN